FLLVPLRFSDNQRLKVILQGIVVLSLVRIGERQAVEEILELVVVLVAACNTEYRFELLDGSLKVIHLEKRLTHSPGRLHDGEAIADGQGNFIGLVRIG